MIRNPLSEWRLRRRGAALVAEIPPGHNAAGLVSTDPPIVLGWTGRLFRFGSASAIAPLFRRRRVTFLISAKGSLADDAEARRLAADAQIFIAEHPHHRFEWLCNIDEETERLRSLGLSAHTHNRNLFLREDVFRPLEAVPRRFDAVYNGRISPEKRNELAAEVPRVAFIVYRDPGEHSSQAFQAAWHEMRRAVPGATLLNRLTEAGVDCLSTAEVNAAYAEADVGLCLSAREGAMRVAVEYQLAGLPIVATPCRGGRDYYLDPETWIVVPPDPGSVRRAVAELQARSLPRAMVRERVMERLEGARRQFVQFVDQILREESGRPGFEPRFRHLLYRDLFARWVPMRQLALEVWMALGGD